jgi:hypothetical protein
LAELGLDVTIAMAAITKPDGYIVTVSDRMISYDNVTQAEDNAALKAAKIAERWGIMFSANDARLFMPLTDKIIAKMGKASGNDRTYHLDVVKQCVMEAYQEMFDVEFSAAFLSRLGIPSVREFRKNGFTELGSDVHKEVYRELSKFDLGIQLLVHGYDLINQPHIFEVDSPGRIRDHDILGYAVIGSGYWMASASLRRRPLSRELYPTIYRLLEAKFSAETATGVGKATTAIIFGPNSEFASTHPDIIADVREVWLGTLKPDAPKAAIQLIAPISEYLTKKVPDHPQHSEQQPSENAVQAAQGVRQLPIPEPSE